MPSERGRLELTRVDRDDPGAHDLGHVRALVDAEREDARHPRALDYETSDVQVVPAEYVRVQQAVVDDHDLDQQRRAAKYPDVDVRHPAHRPDTRQAAQGTQDAQDHADDLARDRDRDGQQQAADDARIGREERVEEDAPVVLVCRRAPAARTGDNEQGNYKQPAERDGSAG